MAAAVGLVEEDLEQIEGHELRKDVTNVSEIDSVCNPHSPTFTSSSKCTGYADGTVPVRAVTSIKDQSTGYRLARMSQGSAPIWMGMGTLVFLYFTDQLP